jgi:glucose-1-phosphatase
MKLSELVKNYPVVLFDMGGVIVDLRYETTIEAFQQLGAGNFDEIYSQAAQTNLFDLYETGKISSMHFINKMKDLLPSNISPNEIVAAWNAMIIEFKPEKLQFLKELKQTHTVGLLSNANELHEEYARRKLAKVSSEKLEDHFHYTYFSHTIHMRKPHPETFLHVCELMNVQPKDVLFIDDSQQHVDGANKAGLNAFLFPQNHPFQ